MFANTSVGSLTFGLIVVFTGPPQTLGNHPVSCRPVHPHRLRLVHDVFDTHHRALQPVQLTLDPVLLRVLPFRPQVDWEQEKRAFSNTDILRNRSVLEK